MHEKIPIVSGKEAAKAFTKMGFFIKRQRGSHIILQKDERIFSIPLHKTLKKGTLHSILKQASISVDEFVKYL